MLDDEEENKKESFDVLEDDENCENLEDVMAEDEGFGEEEEDDLVQEDPWDKQVRMGRRQTQSKYNVW